MIATASLQGAGRAILRTWMLLGLVAAAAGVASAGTIDPKRTVSCDVSFSGDVDPGDAEKLLAALKAVDTKSAPGRRLRSEQEIERGIYLPRLCLNSKGGSFDEAVTFVKAVITKQSLVTVVQKEAECYSACALLFLTGHHYLGDEYVELYRRMHVDSVVGFHAPFVQPIGLPPSDKLVQRSYRAGVEAVAELLNLDQRFFPRSLLAEFLKAGPDEFFKIDEIRHLAAWDIGLTGYGRARSAATGHVEHACRHQQLRNDNVYAPIFLPQWAGEADDDPLSGPAGRQPLPLGRAITRHVVDGMGSEAAFKCVALMQMLGDTLFLSLVYGPGDKHPRDPGTRRPHFLSTKAWEQLPELDPDSYTPAYFLYGGRTKIAALAREAQP